jgi:tetratricopeptide (TPR) repeat protein
MRSVLLFILIFSFGFIHSQNIQINKLLEQYRAEKNETLRATFLNQVAVHYLNTNLDSARKYGNLMHEEALKSKIIKNRWLVRSYFYFADIESKLKNFSEAIRVYKEAEKILMRSKEPVDILSCYNRLAHLYKQIGDEQNAVVYLNKFFADTSAIPGKFMRMNQVARAYNLLGEIHLEHRRYNDAKKCMNLALSYALNGTMKPWVLAVLYYNMGQVYAKLNDNKSSEENFLKSLALNTENKVSDGIILNRIALADLLIKTGKRDKALTELKEIQRILSTTTDKKVLLEYYQSLINLYDELKDYEKKSDYLILRSALSDSLTKITYNQNLAETQTRYETEKKEKENQFLIQKTNLQELEIQQGRTFLVVIVIAAFFSLTSLILIIIQYRLKNKQKAVRLEQKLLRSQMNPHFLFNSLISIESFLYKNDTKQAGRYLSDFARLMRLILENSREEYITLDKEISTLKYYLELQKLRFEESFDYRIHIDEGIDVESTSIPPMLAQPFIENSIEHGLRNINGKGFIEVNFIRQGDELLFEVKDNGPGFVALTNNRSIRAHKSLATEITNERLKLFNKGRSGKISVFMEDIKNALNEVLGGKVTFTIPYHLIGY